MDNSLQCNSHLFFYWYVLCFVQQQYDHGYVPLVVSTSVLSSFMTYHRIFNQINTTGATSGAGTIYPSGAPEFIPSFQWDSCYSIFSLMCMFCRSLCVLVLLAIVLAVLLRFTDSDYTFTSHQHICKHLSLGQAHDTQLNAA